MGVLDFVKNAGEKLFKPGESRRESAIDKHLAGYGIKGIQVEVDGDTASLTGTVTDNATREKAVLMAGNIEGIAHVDDRIRVDAPTPQQAKATSEPAAAATSSSVKEPAPARDAASDGNVGWTSRTYTVKAGDTLSKIAKEMYGEAGKYPQIFEANKPMLKDPDKIYPGQVLRIPAAQ